MSYVGVRVLYKNPVLSTRRHSAGGRCLLMGQCCPFRRILSHFAYLADVPQVPGMVLYV